MGVPGISRCQLSVIRSFVFLGLISMDLGDDNVAVLSRGPVPFNNRLPPPSWSMYEEWFYTLPHSPVDIEREISFLIKTGYGTGSRISPILDAIGRNAAAPDIVVVADFGPSNSSSPYRYKGEGIKVHNVFEVMLQNDELSWMASRPKFRQYSALKAAIDSGDRESAQEATTAFGWELDTIKFIPGMKLLYDEMLNKKWYVILDDDTYPILPSLQFLLERLDHTIPQYIGNPVGDRIPRFAHGRSSIILSHAAMEALFGHAQNHQVVLEAYADSLVEKCGDQVVATALMKIRVALDERFAGLFNGFELPLTTRIWPHRFCLPLVAFHRMSTPERMEDAADRFQDSQEEVKDDLSLGNGDHVGEDGELSMSSEKIQDEIACSERCSGSPACLAWTWNGWNGTCHTSPWLIVGAPRQDGARQFTHSGIEVSRVELLKDRCSKLMKLIRE
ncbi:hypothetical protein V8F20_012487 [Naviculisporaceae sp. PSN 640]